jgi:hypothetical protein
MAKQQAVCIGGMTDAAIERPLLYVTRCMEDEVLSQPRRISAYRAKAGILKNETVWACLARPGPGLTCRSGPTSQLARSAQGRLVHSRQVQLGIAQCWALTVEGGLPHSASPKFSLFVHSLANRTGHAAGRQCSAITRHSEMKPSSTVIILKLPSFSSDTRLFRKFG